MFYHKISWPLISTYMKVYSHHLGCADAVDLPCETWPTTHSTIIAFTLMVEWRFNLMPRMTFILWGSAFWSMELVVYMEKTWKASHSQALANSIKRANVSIV